MERDELVTISQATTKTPLEFGVYKRVSYYHEPNKGICVVAKEVIGEGEVVELAATLRIPPELVHLTDQTPLYHIVYTASDGASDLVVYGNGSLYNHSNRPNLRYNAIVANDRHFVQFIARKAINIGDELTIDYYDDTANEPQFNLSYDPRK